MHATFRRIKTQSGRTADVAALIETEYLPLVRGIEGYVSYTLVDLGDDEVGSVGVFTSAESAEQANATARVWTAERLAPLVLTPLDARAGRVLVADRASTSA